MIIDWNVRFGDLLVMTSMMATVLLYAYKSGRFAESIARMKEELSEMREVAQNMARLLTTVAVQTQRLDTAAERVNMLEQKIEDLRRGNGWIQRVGVALDREYP